MNLKIDEKFDEIRIMKMNVTEIVEFLMQLNFDEIEF